MTRQRKYNLHDGKMGAAITVQIEAHARRNKITDVFEDGTIKVQLAGPADDHRINQALIDYLAEVLAVQSNVIEIIAGQNGQDKLVTVIGLDAGTVHNKILQQL